MTAVATFVLKTELEKADLKKQLSKCWYGKGYEVDICKMQPVWHGNICCVLEYYFYRNLHERTMLRDAAEFLLSVSVGDVIYYRCIDFVGDIVEDRTLDVTQPNYFGGVLVGEISLDDFLSEKYQPSMVSPDVYILKA